MHRTMIMNRYQRILRAKAQSGFSLVELFMTVAIMGMVAGAVFTVYRSHQRSHTAQEAVADMQQNIRAAMLVMLRDIREAGCDPTGRAEAGITLATPGVFQFTRDIGGDADHPNEANGSLTDANENVAFGFSPADDVGRTGIADAGTASLGRNTGGGFQPIADNIQAIEFRYILRDGTLTIRPNAAQFPSIIGVQISLLARAARPDPDYLDTGSYTTAAGTVWRPSSPDHFRRRLETLTVSLRNRL